MALLPLVRARVPNAWGAHGFTVLALAFCERELFLRADFPGGCTTRLGSFQSSSPQNAETSTVKPCAPQSNGSARFLVSLLFAFFLPFLAFAQESPAPPVPPTPSSNQVRLSFVPPPMEGTISLGIYDSNQKLVRILHREAALEDFEVGSDALVAAWDGNNDAGERLPPGRYHARGFAVGEVEVEGIGFFFNDWVMDERSPRVKTVSDVGYEDGRWRLLVETTVSQSEILVLDSKGKFVSQRADARGVEQCTPPPALPLVRFVHCAAGKDRSLWVIDRIDADASETSVKQFSQTGELLRRLSINAGDPQPVRIAASVKEESVLLSEASESNQRVRALTLMETTRVGEQAVSDWKVDFEKKIVAHKDFRIEDGKPVVTGGKSAPEKITVALEANPLEGDKKSTADLSVGYDADGSFLQTADGLPLQTISETPQLTRVVLSPRAEKSLDVFQDDGAVVEQFRLTALDQLMAFDCGEFELK